LAEWITKALKNHDNEQTLSQIKQEVKELGLQFPLPSAKVN
jgi:glycine/serine hydroxymethyltransferase